MTDVVRMKVIIRARSVAELKAHPIWQEIMDHFLEEDEPVSVEEISELAEEPDP